MKVRREAVVEPELVDRCERRDQFECRGRYHRQVSLLGKQLLAVLLEKQAGIGQFPECQERILLLRQRRRCCQNQQKGKERWNQLHISAPE